MECSGRTDHSAFQQSAVQYSAVQCSLQCNAMHYDSMQCRVVLCGYSPTDTAETVDSNIDGCHGATVG